MSPAHTPFDGTGDAPPPVATCSDCGQVNGHANHNKYSEFGHFFNVGEPVIADRVVNAPREEGKNLGPPPVRAKPITSDGLVSIELMRKAITALPLNATGSDVVAAILSVHDGLTSGRIHSIAQAISNSSRNFTDGGIQTLQKQGRAVRMPGGRWYRNEAPAKAALPKTDPDPLPEKLDRLRSMADDILSAPPPVTRPGEHWSNEDVSRNPPLRTTAILADEVEKALRSIGIARVSIGKLTVKPKYAVQYGTGLLSAEVKVEFSMLFAKPEEEEEQ